MKVEKESSNFQIFKLPSTMNYKAILIALFSCLSFLNCYSQQLIFAHRPFSETKASAWRYSMDTVLFSSSASIIGLVNLPKVVDETPTLELVLKNQLGESATASFKLLRFDPSTLRWNAAIKRLQASILNNSNWYYFEISPKPSVVNAYDGVAFLEIIHALAKNNQAVTLTYHLSGEDDSNVCTINFKKEQGVFKELWTKLDYYQNILKKKNSIEQQQSNLIQQCRPYAFSQVSTWAAKAAGLQTDLAATDLDLFRVVENLKIVTEAIPNSISPYLKRELRALLLLDIALVEMPNGRDKTQKKQQKEDLLKQLYLYPELKGILDLYKNTTENVMIYKKTEEEQQKELQEVIKKYRPYKGIYTTYQDLQAELDLLKTDLQYFD
ncbi:MAG: Unknown protein [uncultured Aureispira sp.]|uniref:Uncharacterized protein n=1 Tax=uncultured Aureispira sp. TaxID=1331704 RepID=A0A6S6RXH2_9BACT|nr:MAG: Unknown protein [uncultured Aureispira sp.]